MNEYYVEWISDGMREFGMEFFRQTVQANTLGAKAHIHDSIEIIFVEEGTFHVMVNDTRYCASRGDVLLFRSNMIHSILAESSAINAYYVLKLKPEVFLELASKKKTAGYMMRFSASASSGKTHWNVEEARDSGIEQAFRNLIREYQGDDLCQDISLKIHSFHVILTILRDLMRVERERGILSPGTGSVEEQIYQVITYMHKNFGENLSAAACSKMVNMSYSYFSRCFQKVSGKGFKEYLNEIRVNYAEHLLMTTNMSVTQVALECGYNNVSYFISVYKTVKERTPLADRGVSRREV